jgi:cytosine/adenosine deaminase-related metal-dependent hydrolase
MSFRKLKATRIFDGTRFHEDKTLVVATDGRIEGLLSDTELSDVEYYDGLLVPGFINCHCHLELSHMKGLIPEKTGLVDFVFAVVTQRHHAVETILEAIETAEAEMESKGIMAVGDICNNELTVAQKEQGNLRYYNFVEASGWLPGGAETRFSRAFSLLETYSAIGPSSIVPHAPYSVSSELWQRISPHFAGRVASIHNQETSFEDEFFLQGTGDFGRMYTQMNIDNSHHRPSGKSSLQTYFDRLAPAAIRLLVHNTFTGQDDIRYALAQSPAGSTFFCLCINANLYIESRLPPVELLRAAGAPIVLGTDSLASNRSLGINDEMRTLRQHFPQVPLEEMLQWATLNGARALQMDDILGSFEKGKMPGVLLLDEATLDVTRLL